MYNTIYNDPFTRSCITHPWTFWDDCFTDEELNKVVEYCEKFDLFSGTIIGTEDKELTKDTRKSNIVFINRNDESGWIFDKLNFIITMINERFYNFELNGYDCFQFTTYNAEENGNYDWHMDSNLGNKLSYGETRKLSLTLLLNDDFEGGEFQLNIGKEADAKTLPAKKGRALCFPSYMIHRVTPVTKGIRKSIVVWCLGPKFK